MLQFSQVSSKFFLCWWWWFFCFGLILLFFLTVNGIWSKLNLPEE